MRIKHDNPGFRRFVSCCGDKYKQLYSSLVLPDGRIQLTPTDKLDIQKEIQSHVDECDMTFILSRLAVGDTSVVNRSTPFFADISRLPCSPIEMINLIQTGEDYFNSLPADVRSKFNSDKLQFFAELGSEEFYEKLGFVPKIDQEIDPKSDLDKEAAAE